MYFCTTAPCTKVSARMVARFAEFGMAKVWVLGSIRFRLEQKTSDASDPIAYGRFGSSYLHSLRRTDSYYP